MYGRHLVRQVDHYKPPKKVVCFCSYYQTISRFTTQSRRSHNLTSDYLCKLSKKINSSVCTSRELQLYDREVKTGSLFPAVMPHTFSGSHHLSCQNVVLNQLTRLEHGPPQSQKNAATRVMGTDRRLKFLVSQWVLTTVGSIFSLNFWCSVTA